MGSARGTESKRTSTHVERPSVGSPHDQASPLDPLLELQQTVGNQAVLRLLRAGHAHAKFRNSSSMQGGGGCAAPRARSRPPLTLQKKCASCATGAKCSKCGEEEELQRKAAHPVIQRAAKLPTDTSETPTSETPARPAGLIVEDTTKEISPGQMRKTEFLSTLRSVVRPIVEDAPQVGPDSNGSYVDKWINDSAAKDPAHLEHAVIKYAPSAADATTAQDYIDAVVSQVEWGVLIWSTTGKIIGLPPTFARDLPDTEKKPAADEDTIQRKSADGKDAETDDVSAIRSELSGGNPLSSSVRGPMEKAYGTSFSNVKVHTNSKAAELSANLDARAFTIGSDIAFAAGEFKPGTLVGDALIAHELAHVAQQQGGAASGPATKGAANYGSLEEDADLSAVGAMASIWGGVKEGLAGVARSAIPKLRSGLKLQRCNGDTETKGQTPSPAQPQQTTPDAKQTPAPPPQAPAEKVDFSICTNQKNREKVEAIIKGNPRNYDLTKVRFNIDKFTKNFTEVAKKYVKDNKVTSSTELGLELKELNKGVAEQDGMCVVIIKGWESAAAIAKEKRESCVERIKVFQADATLKKVYTEWVTETVEENDAGYEDVVTRAAKKRSDLFQGRKAEYANEVKRHNDKWIDSLNKGECVALPVGWKDPNIGTLPTKPGSGTLKKTDPAAQAIAVVYAEQTRTSKETGAAANFKEQQKYIWFSIRKRVESANYPPNLAAVLDPGQYHAIGQSDYNSALTDLETNDPPALEALKTARQVVLDNWTSAIPADAGTGYFHWRDPSTPNTCYAGASKLKAEEKLKKEKECAWDWARKIKIVGTVTKEEGWLKRIRAAGDDPVGSMYIYP
ncbi:MAG TPA: DUF4157 domain-containing protein [Pyrinomonadaceae bacterium]|nr:DUF4157 domain-containing protein [Pyrinomonadaceae bacterium]